MAVYFPSKPKSMLVPKPVASPTHSPYRPLSQARQKPKPKTVTKRTEHWIKHELGRSLDKKGFDERQIEQVEGLVEDAAGANRDLNRGEMESLLREVRDKGIHHGFESEERKTVTTILREDSPSS